MNEAVEILVRSATPDDAEGIARVHVKSWQEAYAGLLPQAVLDRQSVPARMRSWSGLLQEPSGARWTFVAVDPGAGIVGFAGGVRARNSARGAHFKIPVVYVLQSHLRRGLGRRLMHVLASAMAEAGSGPVMLWSLAANRAARNFYEGIGGRLVSVLSETDSNGRMILAGYQWVSADRLAERTRERA